MNGTDLNDAIAAVWQEVKNAAGNRLEGLEDALLPLLRRLEAEPGDTKAVEETIKVLGDRGAWAPVERVLAQRGVAKGDRPGRVLSKSARYVSFPVFYATNRAPMENAEEPAQLFGSARGDLSYGSAEISIPDDHKMAKLEKPRWWRLEFSEHPAKHVMVLSADRLPESDFVQKCRSFFTRAKIPEALIFVHGYRTSFGDALRRTAQIAYDLQFKGAPILFSWPSEGAAIPYTVDETNALESRPAFRNALNLISTQLGLERIHLVTHSMGGRLVAESLSAEPGGKAILRELVFAAPDIDAKTFKDLVDKFHNCAARTTLYASDNDKALKLSRTLHKYPRAGEAGIGLVVLDSIDTVDVSALDTSFDGHSYFGDNRSVVSDLLLLIQNATPASQRGLKQDYWNGLGYWRFAR